VQLARDMRQAILEERFGAFATENLGKKKQVNR
jgi:hypothetical protein